MLKQENYREWSNTRAVIFVDLEAQPVTLARHSSINARSKTAFTTWVRFRPRLAGFVTEAGMTQSSRKYLANMYRPHVCGG